MNIVTRRAYIKLIVVIELELIASEFAANMESDAKASGHSLLSYYSALEPFSTFVAVSLLLLAPLPLFPIAIAPIAVGK